MNFRRLRVWVGVLGVSLGASCGGGGLKADGAAGQGGSGEGGAPDVGASDAGSPATTLRASLAGAWSFDNDGKDRSGNMLDLDVKDIPFANGKFGKGLAFAGDGSKIAQRPLSDPELDLATGDFTVMFWVSFNKTASPQFVAVKGYAEGGWFVGWAQTLWGFGFPAPSKGGTFADPSGSSPATGTFHQVFFQRNGVTAQLIIDGRLVGGISVENPPPPAAAPFQVGGYAVGGLGASQSVVDGVVDEVAVWHRMLTSTERAYLATHPVP